MTICGHHSHDHVRSSCHVLVTTPDLHNKLAAIFTDKARMTVLKKKLITLCTSTTRRITRARIDTSETWQVMPITAEK